jgi:hypothetical protein
MKELLTAISNALDDEANTILEGGGKELTENGLSEYASRRISERATMLGDFASAFARAAKDADDE